MNYFCKNQYIYITYGHPGALYSAYSFEGWCPECGDDVSCDTGYWYQFTDYEDGMNHLVEVYEVTYCSKGHAISFEFYTDSLEGHSYNEDNVCTACGHSG